MWSWNYMLSKRWKTPPTGDEQFMTKILNDFRAFCSNADDRLKTFWDNCWNEVLQNVSPADQFEPADEANSETEAADLR